MDVNRVSGVEPELIVYSQTYSKDSHNNQRWKPNFPILVQVSHYRVNEDHSLLFCPKYAIKFV